MSIDYVQKTALVLVDLQNDYFPGGRWTLEGVDQAAAQASKLLEVFRAYQLPIIHVQHINSAAEAPFFVEDTAGADIHPKVSPEDGEEVVIKNQVNSFQGTDLNRLLKDKGIESIVICGAMSHMCVDAITRAGKDFGYHCTVIHDGCATLAMEFNGISVPAEHVHAAFMAALEFGYADVFSTDFFLSRLMTASPSQVQSKVAEN